MYVCTSVHVYVSFLEMVVHVPTRKAKTKKRHDFRSVKRGRLGLGEAWVERQETRHGTILRQLLLMSSNVHNQKSDVKTIVSRRSNCSYYYDDDNSTWLQFLSSFHCKFYRSNGVVRGEKNHLYKHPCIPHHATPRR